MEPIANTSPKPSHAVTFVVSATILAETAEARATGDWLERTLRGALAASSTTVERFDLEITQLVTEKT
jgi:hypothetical protein